MSSPIIWIFIPGLAGFVLLFVRRYQLITLIIGISTCILLALLAWQLVVGEVTTVGNWTFIIQEQFLVAGRQFVIRNSDRPAISLIYAALAFWLIGSSVLRLPGIFIPLSISSVAVLVAALAVEPILYAALLIEVAILVHVLILTPFGESVSRGVLRFLTFQTLSVPFILTAGWLLSGVELQAGNTQDIVRAAIFLGFGFSFQLGIFPLHSWIPMLMEKAHPYIATSVISILMSVTMFFIVGFLQQYPWLQESLNIFDILRLLGILMLVVGGVWGAFQRHLGRMLGFGLILEVGRTLLAMSLPEGEKYIYALTLPRITSMGVWSLSLSMIKNQAGDLGFRSVQGFARLFPVAGAGVILSHFSLVGIPLLAGFPIYLILWEQLAMSGVWISLGAILGSAGFLVGGLRSLAVLVMGPEDIQAPHENWQAFWPRLVLILGMGIMLIVGILPQWFLPLLTSVASNLETQVP